MYRFHDASFLLAFGTAAGDLQQCVSEFLLTAQSSDVCRGHELEQQLYCPKLLGTDWGIKLLPGI